MKNLFALLLCLCTAFSVLAQAPNANYDPDWDGDGNLGVSDLLGFLGLFGDFDTDGDGIWDSVDDCVGVYDPCGVCNGTGEDNDEDGLCDDVDDCVGTYDECGVCNGPGPDIPVIDEILYETDSVFIEVLGEWYVFEYATDTLFTYVCPVSGCTDETASNYDPEAVIEDGSCAYGPLECGGASTVTFDGYTYDLVAIGDQCWFAENLRTEHYTNGDSIPGNLTNAQWKTTNEGAQAYYDNDLELLDLYGRLYNWYSVEDGRGLCPNGWHVPSDEDWMILEIELGMSESEANSMGQRGTDEGVETKASSVGNPPWDGSNISGFTMLPGGYRQGAYGIGATAYLGWYGYCWSSTPGGTNGYIRTWISNVNTISRDLYPDGPRVGVSIRCLKD